MKNIRWGIMISSFIYLTITLITYLITKTFDIEIIKKWGFGCSIFLIIASFPFSKAVYYGGRVTNPIASGYIHPDEYIQLENKQESMRKKEEYHIQGILIWSGFVMFFMVVLFSILF